MERRWTRNNIHQSIDGFIWMLVMMMMRVLRDDDNEESIYLGVCVIGVNNLADGETSLVVKRRLYGLKIGAVAKTFFDKRLGFWIHREGAEEPRGESLDTLVCGAHERGEATDDFAILGES